MFHMKHLIAPPETQPPICDYEGSSYRTEFWGGDQREYENLAERIALRALLPSGGQRLVEIGAGFGSLKGKIWRVGLMGAGSTRNNVMLLLAALARILESKAGT